MFENMFVCTYHIIEAPLQWTKLSLPKSKDEFLYLQVASCRLPSSLKKTSSTILRRSGHIHSQMQTTPGPLERLHILNLLIDNLEGCILVLRPFQNKKKNRREKDARGSFDPVTAKRSKAATDPLRSWEVPQLFHQTFSRLPFHRDDTVTPLFLLSKKAEDTKQKTG